MNHVTMAAFADELSKIAGVGGFLAGGLKGWGKVLSGKASGKGLKRLTTSAYRRGAAGQTGAKGVWGGVKGVAKSQIGQMAGAAAIPVGAGYTLGRLRD